MVRRVRRPKNKADVLNWMTDSQTGVFETYKDALVFAAALGFAEGERETFDSTSEPIDTKIFSGRPDTKAIFGLLSLAENGSIDTLSTDQTEERLTIFEEYANGGLEILKRYFDRGDPCLDAALELVSRAQDRRDSEEPDFDELISELAE